MNCQDISRIVDTGNFSELTGTQRRAAEAHALTCRHCAPTWAAHSRLSDLRIPAMPEELAASCRLLSAAPVRIRSGYRLRRLTVVGSVVALAAAAAMLATWLAKPVVSTVVADPAPMLITSADDTRDAPASLGEPGAGAMSAAPGGGSQAVPLTTSSFTVQVLPLQGDVIDAPLKEVIAEAYATFVDGLRSVPGLKLMELAADGNEAQVSPDFRISLEGQAVLASSRVEGDFFLRMVAQRLGVDGSMISSLHTGMVGEVAPGCASPLSMDALAGTSPCADSRGVATGLLNTLRKGAFPPDPQLMRGAQARLVDQTLDPGERLRALLDLRSLARTSVASARERDAFPATLGDSAVIGAAIQLASVAPDPVARAQVWYTLRGSRDPELVRPLVAALRNDGDDDTRVQALATLAADFADDPRVHAALETAAAGDPDPLVRALAQRSLGSASGWTEYVQTSLKNAALSPMERIEAFFYAYGLPTSRQYGAFDPNGRILRELDDAAIRALTEVLPLAAADSPGYARASLTLVNELADMEHPAITNMLIDGLDTGAQWLLARSIAVEALQRRTDDPRVRSVLEKIAAEDVDPQLRELAANTLSGPTLQPHSDLSADGTSATTPGPPRLGVMAAPVQPGRDVPPELVGRLMVMRMSPASAAVRAGVKEEDVLLEIDGTPISSVPQLLEVLDALPRDVDVEVLVSREGQTLRLTARF